MRLLSWLLAIACLVLALVGFLRGGDAAAATLGFPGSSAALFFVALARAASLDRSTVARLGSWPLYGSGAALSVGALAGASTLLTPGGGLAALPLAVLGCPVLAVACLRLSTGSGRAAPWFGVAAGAMAMAIGGGMLLVRLAPAYGL